MPTFSFRLPTREQIRTSRNGNVMLEAINSDSPRNKAIMIKGCPGSGKTTVTIYRLIRLLNSNRRVILLIYNEMLRIAIQNTAISNGDNISGSVKGLFKWFYAETSRYYAIFGNHSVPSADELIVIMTENGFKNREYYELLVDEGQDLNPKFYKSFPHFFSRISVGADEAQKLYDHGGSEDTIQDILEEYAKFDEDVKTFPLEYNYRNTYSTINFARQFVPSNAMANMPKMLADTKTRNKGEKPDVRILKNRLNHEQEIKRLIENLTGQGVNIAVLLPTGREVDVYYSLIKDKYNNECSRYYNKMNKVDKTFVDENLKNILVTTFHSAKGMEFDYVILPEFNLAEEDKSNHYYVACTRAANQLYILCINKIPKIMKSFKRKTYELIDETDNNDNFDLPF